MFKVLINDAQKKVIENLMNASTENADAILAMAADMYHQGTVKGAIAGGIMVAIGMTTGAGISAYIMYKDTKKKLEIIDQQLKEETKGGEEES